MERYDDYSSDEPRGLSITSAVLGVIGLLTGWFPLVSCPVTIVGLLSGIFGMKRGGRGMAVAGLVMSIIGLLITIYVVAVEGVTAYQQMHFNEMVRSIFSN